MVFKVQIKKCVVTSQEDSVGKEKLVASPITKSPPKSQSTLHHVGMAHGVGIWQLEYAGSFIVE